MGPPYAILGTCQHPIQKEKACIVVCGNPKNRSVYLDGSAATQNMLLAIHSLGYSSCWVQAFEKDYNPALKELINIPANLVLVALVPVGLAKQQVPTPKKRLLDDVIHWEQY